MPGCGRGFDVFLLAEFGYDAYGLENSSTAVEECDKMAERMKDSIRARDAKVGIGNYSFVQGDFFKDDWLESAEVTEGGFDLIYDYTVSQVLIDVPSIAWPRRCYLAPSNVFTPFVYNNSSFAL